MQCEIKAFDELASNWNSSTDQFVTWYIMSDISFSLLPSNPSSRSQISLHWITLHFTPILSFPPFNCSSPSAWHSPWRWLLHCTSKLRNYFNYEHPSYTLYRPHKLKEKICNLYQVSQNILIMGMNIGSVVWNLRLSQRWISRVNSSWVWCWLDL